MHVQDKRFGCKILLHKCSHVAADPTLLKYFSGFKFEQYNRWRWFFRYLTARYQVENPRLMVELREFSFDYIPTDEEKRNRIKNKLRSAKAKVTEWSNKLEAYKASYNSIFPVEDDILFQKAAAKVLQKKIEVEQYEKELSQL